VALSHYAITTWPVPPS